MAAAGCAIHPLPEDVAGAPTYVIVRQIRCETRQAVIDNALGWLASDPKVDPASRQIGLEFRNGRPIQQFSPKLFKGEVAAILSVFYDTGVAYTFDLDMSELNNFDPQIDLLKPFTHSKFTMGIKGTFDRKRENERLFTVTDSFSGLIKMPDDYCVDPKGGRNYVVSENYVYPINGRIGVKRMVQDFVELTLFGGLGGPKDKTNGPPTLVDQLSFTTEISGTVTPTITFTPAGTGLSLADASLSASVDRKDLHKVTVGLAIAGHGVSLVGPLRNSLTPLAKSPKHECMDNGAAGRCPATFDVDFVWSCLRDRDTILAKWRIQRTSRSMAMGPVYVAFDGDKDKWAYGYMKGWKTNQRVDFDFEDAHDLDSMTGRAQNEDYVKSILKERMKQSDALALQLRSCLEVSALSGSLVSPPPG